MIKSLYCLAVRLQSLPLILLLQLLFALSQQCQLPLCQGCWSLWVNVWYATRDIDRKLHWFYSLYHSDFLWSRPLLLTHLSSVFSSTAALCLFFILTSVCVSVDLPATLRKKEFISVVSSFFESIMYNWERVLHLLWHHRNYIIIIVTPLVFLPLPLVYPSSVSVFVHGGKFYLFKKKQLKIYIHWPD